MPKRFHGPPAVVQHAKVSAKKLRAQHAKAKAKAKAEAKATATRTTQDKPLAQGAWFALPLALLGLAIIIPLTVGGFIWYRNRKAERDYFRSAGHDNPGSGT
jgi:hypothetical protein